MNDTYVIHDKLITNFRKRTKSPPSMFKSRDTGKFRKALPCVPISLGSKAV